MNADPDPQTCWSLLTGEAVCCALLTFSLVFFRRWMSWSGWPGSVPTSWTCAVCPSACWTSARSTRRSTFFCNKTNEIINKYGIFSHLNLLINSYIIYHNMDGFGTIIHCQFSYLRKFYNFFRQIPYLFSFFSFCFNNFVFVSPSSLNKLNLTFSNFFFPYCICFYSVFFMKVMI